MDKRDAEIASLRICWKAEIAWRKRLQEYVATKNEVVCNHPPEHLDIYEGRAYCLSCWNEEEK